MQSQKFRFSFFPRSQSTNLLLRGAQKRLSSLKNKDLTMNINDTAPQVSATSACLLDIVTDALEAKDRFPCQRPVLGLPGNLDNCDVAGFYLEQRPGGWGANITFDNLPPGAPQTLGTPDASPFPSKRLAFIAGAALLCKILTGSEDLPFFVTADKLLVAGHGTGGYSGVFAMMRPLPWAP
ncbi:hypothetical protein [Roseovarius sp. D0-M9]|uniref:hypothetical protein n=1 Tax=Roseovarius sp. D0-M9 TaxID=3127117 RepID=UPI0030100EED